jgi:D-alanine-D-alanine ligase-like ATP-grasp enzyme
MFRSVAIIEAGLKNSKIWWFERLRRLTDTIILVQPYDLSWEREHIDEFIPCSYSSWGAQRAQIAARLKALDVAAIFPLCEGTTKYGNDLRRLLGFPPVTRIYAGHYTNKQKMRDRCGAMGIRQPLMLPVAGASIGDRHLDRMSFPLVVKPAEMMGSLGVRLVEDKTQLAEAIRLARTVDFPGEDLRKRYGASDQVLVEEFIAGKEYSVECIVRDGKPLLSLVTEKFKSDLPYFDEVGHIANPPLGKSLENEISAFANQIVLAMAFNNGICHIEMICNDRGIYLVEIAARPAGCWIPYVHMLGGQFDIVEAVLSVLGKEQLPSPVRKTNDPAGVFFPFVTDDNKAVARDLMACLPPPPSEISVHRQLVYEAIEDASIVPGNVTERLGMILATGDYGVMRGYFEELSHYCSTFGRSIDAAKRARDSLR